MPHSSILDESRIDEAIAARHSVRQFTSKPIEGAVRERLEGAVASVNEQGGLNIQLACDEAEAFSFFLSHYGKFDNVRNYLALVAPKDGDGAELCGYYGEQLVLLAQQLGLNSCWVGGTFSKRKTRCAVAKGQRLLGTIALGYGISQGTPSKSKGISELCATHGFAMPDWFQRGMEAARLAPTAFNRQRFVFTLSKDQTEVTASSAGAMAAVNLGIAECHFELASGHSVSGSAMERRKA